MPRSTSPANEETDAETCPSSDEDDINETCLRPHRGEDAAAEADAKGAKKLAEHAQSPAHERAELNVERRRHEKASMAVQEMIRGHQAERARLATERDRLQEASRQSEEEARRLAEERASLEAMRREAEEERRLANERAKTLASERAKLEEERARAEEAARLERAELQKLSEERAKLLAEQDEHRDASKSLEEAVARREEEEARLEEARKGLMERRQADEAAQNLSAERVGLEAEREQLEEADTMEDAAKSFSLDLESLSSDSGAKEEDGDTSKPRSPPPWILERERLRAEACGKVIEGAGDRAFVHAPPKLPKKEYRLWAIGHNMTETMASMLGISKPTCVRHNETWSRILVCPVTTREEFKLAARGGVTKVEENHFPPEALEGMRADRRYNEEARLSGKLRHYIISLPAQDKIPYLWKLETDVANGRCLRADIETEEWDRVLDKAVRLGWPDKGCCAPLERRDTLRERVKGRFREGVYGTYAKSLLDWIDKGGDGVPAVDIALMSVEEIRGHILAEAREVERSLAPCGARGSIWTWSDEGADGNSPTQGWNDGERGVDREKGDAWHRCTELGDKAEADRVSALCPAGLASPIMA